MFVLNAEESNLLFTNKKLCCKIVLEVCSVFKNVVQENICQTNSCNFCQTVSVRVPAHEVNYYGPIKHAGIVTECKLGQENNTHIQKWDRKYANPSLLSVSVVMQVALLAALLKPRGKTQKSPSVIPIPSWRGWSWGWSSWRRYTNHCLQTHRLKGSYRCSFYYSVSDPKQYLQYIWDIYDPYLFLWPCDLSPWLVLWPAVWSDVHRVVLLADHFSSTSHSPNLQYWQEIQRKQKWNSQDSFFVILDPNWCCDSKNSSTKHCFWPH